MLRAVKYELNPTKAQKELIKQTCGCCRLVYNTMLERKVNAYKKDNTRLSAIDLINQLPQLKKEKEFLKEVPSQSLQQAIRNLDGAFNFFFKHKGNFPKFKKKGVKDSFRIPVACVIDYNNWTIKTAKIGVIKFYKGNNKPINGKIKFYTISRTHVTDRYFISITYETVDKEKLNNDKTVGIDVGITHLATLSDGKVFENQKYLQSNLRKLRVLQRAADRKYQRGKTIAEQSNNYRKALAQVSKLHERIAFQRRDYLQKVTTWIARNYSTVCVETLNIDSIRKSNRRLAREISDCGLGMFMNMLEYKCDNLVKIDKWFASSQTCYVCGHKEQRVKNTGVRQWTCPVCGTRHNRDLNAARNIEREGLSLCGHKVSGYTMPVPRTQSQNGSSQCDFIVIP